MTQPDALCLGFCCMDTLLRVPELTLDGKVQITSQDKQGGGPAATAAVCIARLGHNVGFIGACSNDADGTLIMEEFANNGVDTHGIIVQQDGVSPCGYCLIEEETRRRTIAWSHGSIVQLQQSDIQHEDIASAKIMLFDGHHPQAALYSATIAQEHQVTTVLDAGSRHTVEDQLIAKADIVIASQQFSRETSASEEETLLYLSSLGPRVSIITKGPQGYVGIDDSGHFNGPTFPVTVVDTTGAGDVFHGAFVAATLEGADPRSASRFAAAAASISTTAVGGRTALPTTDMVMELMQSQGKTHE